MQKRNWDHEKQVSEDADDYEKNKMIPFPRPNREDPRCGPVHIEVRALMSQRMNDRSSFYSRPTDPIRAKYAHIHEERRTQTIVSRIKIHDIARQRCSDTCHGSSRYLEFTDAFELEFDLLMRAKKSWILEFDLLMHSSFSGSASPCSMYRTRTRHRLSHALLK